jgi:EAL domain-containing protein (putative c-di-GMP-specific phosphodiesterase class I)
MSALSATTLRPSPARSALGAPAQRRRHARDTASAQPPAGAILLFQPRHILGSGARAGADTSLRWQNGRRTGNAGPDRAGADSAIAGWAVGSACAAASGWPDGRVSVAVTPSQLIGDLLQLHIVEALDATGLAPERLEIGLDETMLEALDEPGLFLLAGLRDLGVGLAFDNFGAGAASMTLLRRLPLTTLNLSRALVRGLLTSAEDAAVIDALCAAATAIGLVTVAKGVESQAQRDRLARAGCDQGQGPLFGEAVPAAAFATQVSAFA